MSHLPTRDRTSVKVQIGDVWTCCGAGEGKCCWRHSPRRHRASASVNFPGGRSTEGLLLSSFKLPQRLQATA
jgi:hypothetical protein